MCNLCVFVLCVLASASFTSVLIVCTRFIMPSHQVDAKICATTVLAHCSTELKNTLIFGQLSFVIKSNLDFVT